MGEMDILVVLVWFLCEIYVDCVWGDFGYDVGWYIGLGVGRFVSEFFLIL